MDHLLGDDEPAKKPKRPSRIGVATYVEPDDAAKLAFIRSKLPRRNGKQATTAEVIRRLIRFGYDHVTKRSA
jgi:hypothetical protein